ALNEAGQVLGANRRALELLGDSAHHLRRSGVQSLFDTDLSGLIDQARAHPEQALLLAFVHGRGTHHGEPIHARLSLGTTQAPRGNVAAAGTPINAAQPVAAIVVALPTMESEEAAKLTASKNSANSTQLTSAAELDAPQTLPTALAVASDASERWHRHEQCSPDLKPSGPTVERKAGVLEERRSQKWPAAPALQPPPLLPPSLLATDATASGGAVQSDWQMSATPAPTLRQAELLA
ncbi:hypothetical protein ACVBEH_24050, partial [Roseateles sp. GG27B]